MRVNSSGALLDLLYERPERELGAQQVSEHLAHAAVGDELLLDQITTNARSRGPYCAPLGASTGNVPTLTVWQATQRTCST